MQVQNIKRPNLFDSFFNKELDYKNEFVEYINTTSNNSNPVHKKYATSTLHKKAKNSINNIKKLLKIKKFDAFDKSTVVKEYKDKIEVLQNSNDSLAKKVGNLTVERVGYKIPQCT